MHRTTRSTRAATAVAAVASLALVAPAAVAAPERPDGPAVPDQQARSLEVSRAAEQATAEQAKIKVKGTPPGRSTPATDALDAGMEKVVTNGAVGVTVRV